jgi:hypothetical protein
MDHFKVSQELQELKRKLKHNIAKSKIGHDVSEEEIDDLRNAISAIEKRLFSGDYADSNYKK